MHVMKRGGRGLPIVRDHNDRSNFVQSLLYLNDEHRDENWRQALKDTPFPERPPHWPVRKPLVDLWAWTLMPNHFHLIVRERRDGGISKFMQRFCGSLSAYANAKYAEKGSLFQGGYKGRVVSDDADLRWLASYVMVKNTLELYPGGLVTAAKEFEKAWEWGSWYEFSSMSSYARHINSPIVAIYDNPLLDWFKDRKKFKKDSRDMIVAFADKIVSKDQKSLVLE